MPIPFRSAALKTVQIGRDDEDNFPGVPIKLGLTKAEADMVEVGTGKARKVYNEAVRALTSYHCDRTKENPEKFAADLIGGNLGETYAATLALNPEEEKLHESFKVADKALNRVRVCAYSQVTAWRTPASETWEPQKEWKFDTAYDPDKVPLPLALQMAMFAQLEEVGATQEHIKDGIFYYDFEAAQQRQMDRLKDLLTAAESAKKS
jgi:hypothetical protein